jgi:hypothetical protein
MSCTLNWWNLPIQIKEKLSVNLQYNWQRLPIELNVILREYEQNNNECYLEFFEPNYKFIWFTLPYDIPKLCSLIDCVDQEVLLIEGESEIIMFRTRDTETYSGYFNALEQVTIDGESALGDNRIEVEQITASTNWTIDAEGNITFIGAGEPHETIQVKIVQKNKPDNFILFDVFLAMRNNASRAESVTPPTICTNDLGAELTITGKFFTSLTGIPYVTDVLFENESALSFTIVNSTTIKAVPPLTVTAYLNTTGTVEVVSDEVFPSIAFFAVKDPPVLPEITGDSEVCSSDTLQLAIASAGAAWSSSNDLIATVDGNGLVTGVASGEVDILFSLTDYGCTSTVSKTITVYAEPIIITNPLLSETILEGEDKTISVVATGDGLTYQWFYYDVNDDTYYPLVNDAIFSGVTTKDLLITNAPLSIDSYDVYCEVSGNALCGSAISGNCLIRVGDIGIVSHPQDKTVCEGNPATFGVIADGTVISYIWYIDSGLGFELVSGYVGNLIITGDGTDNITVSNINSTNNGVSFFVQIDSSTGTYYSNAASLTVNEC